MKIGNMIEERDIKKEREEQKQKKKFAIIVVIIVSITIGVATFLVSNSILNKNKEEPVIQDEVLSLTDENVRILYQYISYGELGERYNKFVQNESVTMNDFKNQEKLYYALQFAMPEDFEFTGERDSNKNKIYVISDDKIKEYMVRFFGANITYKNEATFTHIFDFKINGMNVGVMKYNSERGGYDTIFNKNEEVKDEKSIKPFYTSLYGAVIKPDGKMVIKEKVIYTRVNESSSTVDLYKDPNKGILIGNEPFEKDKEFNIDVENMKNTGFIEYTFALNNTIFYFESSKITN